MAEAQQPTALDRFLRLFTDIRAGESVTALLLATNVFLLLTCYSVLKPVREALILGGGSAEIKSYTNAAQMFVLAAIIPLYGHLADRVPRRRLINVVTWIFSACLVGFYALAQLGVGQLGPALGIVFFIWLGIFSLMLISQFWAFANDIYTKEEGERLFPIVALGASVGAVAGAGIAGVLIAPFGAYQMMIVGLLLLLAELQLTNYVDSRERRLKEAHLPPEESTAELMATTGSLRVEDIQRMLAERDKADRGAGERPPEQPAGARPTGAFALVFRTRYLLAIGVMLMLLNLVNTTGEYILGDVVRELATSGAAAGQTGGLGVEDFIGNFFARFQFSVNLAAVLIQLFLVSRIIKYLGVRVGVMILPIISLGAYSLIAFYPVLEYIRWAKTAENSTDYSLNNTVKNTLFLPATREQKYKAKQAIDSFFVRVGDTLHALLVLFGTHVVVLSTTDFARANVVFILAWLVLAFWIGKEYQRLVTTGETPS